MQLDKAEQKGLGLPVRSNLRSRIACKHARSRSISNSKSGRLKSEQKASAGQVRETFTPQDD